MSTDSGLRRYNLTVTKDKSGSDNAQVPASVTAHFYVKAALVITAVTIQDYEVDARVSVQDVGRIVVGDVLVKRTTTSPSVTVSAIVDRATLEVSSNNEGTFVLAAGDVVVQKASSPTVYKDSTALDPYSSSQVATDSATGQLLPAFLPDRLFDVFLTGTGVNRVLNAQAGGAHFPVYNVREMGGDIQTVIDALPDTGGVVYLPAGDYLLSAGLVVNKPNVTLVGDGFNSMIRAAYDYIDAFDLITVNRPYFRAYNLFLDCRSTSQNLTTGHCGIVMNGLGVSGYLVLECYLENVQITGASRYGLWLRDTIIFLAVNCEFGTNKGHGARLQIDGSGSTNLRFLGCGFAQNGGKGVEAEERTCLTFNGCWFEGDKSGWDTTEGNGIDANECGRLEVLSCYFEDAATGVTGPPNHRTEQFVRLQRCPSAIVEGCWFQGGVTEVPPQHLKPHRAVRFVESAASRLSNNTAENMQTEFALFESDSPKCVEMGNNYLDNAWSGVPAISGRVFNLSQGGVGLYSYPTNTDRPDATSAKGSLIWVDSPGSDSNLQISDGSGWKNITFS